MSFFSIHNHTAKGSNLRLRDSINKIPDMIEYALELGLSGLCITDHESVTASLDVIEYYFEHKDLPEWKDFKLGLGNEIYLCPRSVNAENKKGQKYPHFVLVALDAFGHKGIRELSTNSWINNSFMSVMMRVPTYYDELEDMLQTYKGHIIGSSACLGGSLPGRILMMKDSEESEKEEIYQSCVEWIEYMNEIFGSGYFFLEMQPSTKEEQIFVNQTLIRLSEDTNTPYIITTDSHYTRKEDRKYHKIYLESQDGEREVDDFYETTYLMNGDELHAYMDESLGYDAVQKGIDNTQLIYDKITEYDLRKQMRIPYVPFNLNEPDPNLYKKYSHIEHLDYFFHSEYMSDRHLCREIINKLEEKPEELCNQETYDAIAECLDSLIIASDKMNVRWSAYLLDVQDIVKLLWEVSLVGAGRGCFTPENRILMADGTTKPIAEVKIGDKVITHLGNKKDVLNVFEYPCEEEMYEIKASDTETIKCTNNHKFFAVSTGRCYQADFPSGKGRKYCTPSCKRYAACSKKQRDFVPQWIEAKDLKIGDYIVYPKNAQETSDEVIYDLSKYDKDLHYDNSGVWYVDNLTGLPKKRINRFIRLDSDFSTIAGWFISQGWTRNEETKMNYEVGFAHHSQKQDLIAQNCSLFKKVFGEELVVCKHPTRQVIQLRSYSKILATFFETLFGKYAENKYIPRVFIDAPKNIKASLLYGLWTGDGCVSVKKCCKTKYSTINYNLAKQVQMLLATFDIPSSINVRHHKEQKWHDEVSAIVSNQDNLTKLNEIVQNKIVQDQQYGAGNKRNLSDEKYIYYPIRQINTFDYKGKVYDLSVQDDTSYVVESAAVHNSGVGFILNYILGITQINPLKERTRTFSWRFLNPERASPLDIDVDIEGAKRDAVIEKFRDKYGKDRISKVMTLSTEKGRSAILTAARGLGIDNDVAQYIASLMVADRGNLRTLHQMYYGDEENKPVSEFVTQMNLYPELWECAQKFEGLVCGVGSHAGGIILNDEPFTEVAAQMKTNSGDIITQFDLHECEKLSLIKFDCLSIEALDKMHACLNLLLDDGVIEWQGTLKDTYEKYLNVYGLERDSEEMWKMLWEHKVISFFQMEKESGIQAISLSKPHSVDDLAALNSVMRLMAQEKGGEVPLHKYARFKNDINQWYEEMTSMGLTEEEQDILKDILGVSYGICEAQEYLFLLVMHPKIGGFSLAWADKLRKSVAKKSPKDFEKLQQEFFENAKEKHLSNKLVNYVWYTLVFMQRGYGFNRSHCLAYSIVGLQELNLCYKYGTIYWSAANLIVDSGSYNEEANDGTDYGKMATAIATIKHEGTDIALPLINEAGFGFKVDSTNNRIFFSLKAMNGIGTELVQSILANRPYKSIEDFGYKMLGRTETIIDPETGQEETVKVPALVQTSKMIQLIKGGCFTEIHSKDRKETMDWFLKKYVFTPADKITMSQLGKMIELDMIPDDLKLSVRMINFKKYVLDDEGFLEGYIDPEKKRIPKRGYHDGRYILDANSQPFFTEYYSKSIVGVKDEYYIISEKAFEKEVEEYIKPLKEWMSAPETLQLYNQKMYNSIWEKYASGSLPHWSMQALCFYDGEHELEHVKEREYGIMNFFDLPIEPEPYEWYTRYINGKSVAQPKFKISRIAGTVLKTDNNRHTVTLLTKYGVVNVKMNKGHYAFYNKRIKSKDEETNKGKIIENSWLQRGNLLVIAGMRRGDQFIPKIYKDTVYKHTVNLIKEVHEDGTLLLQSERTKV